MRVIKGKEIEEIVYGDIVIVKVFNKSDLPSYISVCTSLPKVCIIGVKKEDKYYLLYTEILKGDVKNMLSIDGKKVLCFLSTGRILTDNIHYKEGNYITLDRVEEVTKAEFITRCI